VVAVDTNVVVRLLTADDTRQTERARLLFDTETIFLAKTVLLEAAWVLRNLYRLTPSPVIDVFEGLMGLQNVRCEDEAAVREALDMARQGMDIADAFHLASSRAASRFATFDQRMIQIADKIGRPVAEP
jgi:predicted nucleic-acid-binding protein